ncbi:hypothetical protein [Frankia sp. Cas3]|uniref:hypothetical protein n=1 Tax=Frankia sp. Cas3 TaxID=3073926 RepID=UPI002AD37797|nr:hypothetical protein [Frankia sp. Cas3]
MIAVPVLDLQLGTSWDAAKPTFTTERGTYDDLAQGVVSVSSARFNAAGDTAVFAAVPATGPSDTTTKDIVHTIRKAVP